MGKVRLVFVQESFICRFSGSFIRSGERRKIQIVLRLISSFGFSLALIHSPTLFSLSPQRQKVRQTETADVVRKL